MEESMDSARGYLYTFCISLAFLFREVGNFALGLDAQTGQIIRNYLNEEYSIK